MKYALALAVGVLLVGCRSEQPANTNASNANAATATQSEITPLIPQRAAPVSTGPVNRAIVARDHKLVDIDVGCRKVQEGVEAALRKRRVLIETRGIPYEKATEIAYWLVLDLKVANTALTKKAASLTRISESNRLKLIALYQRVVEARQRVRSASEEHGGAEFTSEIDLGVSLLGTVLGGSQ